jgi:hypothetical protein
VAPAGAPNCCAAWVWTWPTLLQKATRPSSGLTSALPPKTQWGGGTGANILVGGLYLVVELKPLSVQQRTGINVAAGVAEIELHFVR